MSSRNTVPPIEPITLLRRILDPVVHGSTGELVDVKESCQKLMHGIEQTAKEVGGDVQKSLRYRSAQEIHYHIRELEKLMHGTYTFVTAGDNTVPDKRP